MLESDQNVAIILREAGQNDLAAAISRTPDFQCNTANLWVQHCLELSEIHQRQQLCSDALAVALVQLAKALFAPPVSLQPAAQKDLKVSENRWNKQREVGCKDEILGAYKRELAFAEYMLDALVRCVIWLENYRP